MPELPPDFKESPGEQALAILARELPGFKSMIDEGTDTIRVRGPVFFEGRAGLEALFRTYLVPEDVERFTAELIRKTREHAIAALGLETMIREELQRARHEASVAAFADGKVAGKAEGRREMLAEILAAREGSYDE